MSKENVVCAEVMELTATPAQVREFILTPARILDYYPQPVDGGVLEPGNAIWCRGQMGVSMLERLPEESNDMLVVVKVSTAFGLEGPYTRKKIEEHTMFTMIEDWALEETEHGTRLTKVWRDVVARGPEPFPIADAVREGATAESAQLVARWNAAASSSHSSDASA